MDLPKNIQAQEEEADRLFNELYGGGKTTPVASETKEELKATNPEEEEVVVVEEPVEVVEESSSTETENAELKEALRKSEHKLSVMTGKYDSEVPRLHSELGSLKEAVDELKDKPKREADTASFNQAFAKMQEDYGKEFIDAVDFLVDRRVGEKIAPVEGQIKDMAGGVAMSAKDTFFTALDAKAPKWREYNNEQGFLKFLSRTEQYTGKKLHDLAIEAEKANDSNTVAKFYLEYEKLKEVSGKKKDKREKLIAVTGSAGVETVSHSIKDERWTRPEISAFYEDVRKGKFDGKEKEMNNWELRINRAVAEGRVD